MEIPLAFWLSSTILCTSHLKETKAWELPSGPVIRSQSSHCPVLGSFSGQGTKIPQAAWLKKKTYTKISLCKSLPLPPGIKQTHPKHEPNECDD